MNFINDLIDFKLFKVGEYSLDLGVLLTVIATIIFTKMFLWGIKKLLFRNKALDKHRKGSFYSLFQLIKYIAWITTTIIILNSFGLQLNALLAGSAALLVGAGFGLQNTFNDFISGIILLFEGTIKVGDILEIDKDVVQIQAIGLRTSEAINRDDIVSIIPNSTITSNKVINWTHQSDKTRFRIKVGVAYGSNVELVEQILKESALEHPETEKKSSVLVHLLDFGESSLDFELFFFSQNIFHIEDVKSDIRKIINQKFIKNKIVIPFTQMDLHFKSNNTEILLGSGR